MMGEWECNVCGYLHEGEEPPVTCPECGAPGTQFEFYSYEDNDEWDDELAGDDDELDEDWDDTLVSVDGYESHDELT